VVLAVRQIKVLPVMAVVAVLARLEQRMGQPKVGMAFHRK
jgi:hypothetical protein